jgi:hypothetical protein
MATLSQHTDALLVAIFVEGGGQRVGRMARLETASEQAILWSNGNLLSYVLEPLDAALDFAQGTPRGSG